MIRLRRQAQQQCLADVPPVPPTGAMVIQSSLAMQAGQSYPQQLVRLVGHRHSGDAVWVRPRPNTNRT